MSLFQCENCGCCENTALSFQGFKMLAEEFDWSYAPDREGMLLCSACGPSLFKDGDPSVKGGKWHGSFPRVFLPKGQFKTDRNGNLAHIESGDTNYLKYKVLYDE